MELLIGTSGYDYKEWKGVFYPDTLKHADFLPFYATQFNSLELNGTYYKMPTPAQMQNMITRTSGKVTFSVKAFQGLTHAPDKSQFRPLAAEFKRALEPLQNGSHLLCALLQFPQSFHYEKDERIYLDLLLKELSGIPIVVEMRNVKWQNDQVYNALRQRQTGWCITDNPSQLLQGNTELTNNAVSRSPNIIPCRNEGGYASANTVDTALKNLPKLEFLSTSPIAYIRFHGRNAQMWYTGSNVTRYDYFYTDAELQAFVAPVKELLKNTKIVQLFFNNHAKSQATVNAKKLEFLIKSETLHNN